MKIVKLENVIDNSFGGKAYGLSLLNRYGYLVPETFCIAPVHSIDEIDDTFKKELLIITGERENYHFAVRSSSKVEDACTESKAGHYLTMIGDYDIDALIDAIKQVVMSGEQMGVILQEAIDADYSGVFFSSNPTTFSKKNGILSYIHGLGDGLVSGLCSGTDIEVCFENYSDPQFKNIVFQIKLLEGELGYPIDVEWCIKNNIIYYLQCRPITSITSVKPGFYKTDKNCLLPNQITSHDKIQLRLEAEKANMEKSESDANLFETVSSALSKVTESDSKTDAVISRMEELIRKQGIIEEECKNIFDKISELDNTQNSQYDVTKQQELEDIAKDIYAVVVDLKRDSKKPFNEEEEKGSSAGDEDR